MRGGLVLALVALAGCIEPTLCAPCVAACEEGLACVAGRCVTEGLICAAEDDAATPDAATPDAAPDAAPDTGRDAELPIETGPCEGGERLVAGRCVGPLAMDVAGSHACAVWADGPLSCWGFNHEGRLGVSDVRIAARPVWAEGLTDVTAVATGGAFTCAVAAGQVVCFGGNDAGQSAVVLPPGFEAVRLIAGDVHVCAQDAQGALACWGYDEEGQLGRGYLDADPPPRFEQVALGWGHGCGLQAGVVTCWGGENLGEKGGAGAGPQVVAFGRPVTHLATGSDFTCAILDDGALRCIGAIAVSDAGPFRAVDASALHACALRVDGAVRCFGYLTPSSFLPAPSPRAVAGPLDRLVVGVSNACLHAPGRAPDCWGLGGRGVLTEAYLEALAPAEIPGDAAALAVGGRHACRVGPTGEVACWGLTWRGRTGRPGGVFGVAPTVVPGLAGRRVAAWEDHTCVVLQDGGLACFGENDDGQVAPGAAATVSLPRRVAGLDDVEAVVTGSRFTCAQRAAGRVTCFGADDRGQLGGGLGELPPLHGLAAGTAFACGLDADGAVWCWGDDRDGQVSGVPAEAPAAPRVVGGLPPAQAVALGEGHACALADGRVYCWGRNANGELGRGTVGDVEIPAPVPGLADVDALAAGPSHTCALRGGQVICFGLQAYERFGRERFSGDQGIYAPAIPPTTIEGLTDAVEIAVGGGSACARRADATVACFGFDEFGVVSGLAQDPGLAVTIRSPR
ncbi:MAG: hypothetical protein H6706_29730 [Myxococcales bacterium]|nr:hypothetical protein [Myxococcales bacterium]